jgi:AraC-like DNA-binding protein
MIERAMSALGQGTGNDEEFIRCVFDVYKYGLLYIIGEMEIGCPSCRQLRFDAQTSVSALFEQFMPIIEEACQLIEDRNSNMGDELGRSIVSYVDANYGDPDLYIASVTDEFSISEHALQKYMRELTGKSFFDCLEGLRMNSAWELVTKSDLPIRAIIGKCGYSSHNSFYKAFKRGYGVSPSTLRKTEGRKAGGESSDDPRDGTATQK